ncbi:anaerobic ribonucleoside-triphosphate reductase activating protein [Ruminiclostridium sufflavum DSM 19573]|uniref:Anaerobic ribonucleoside-triphosphate reductase-activating protein n=1 Tax=Ruminiclostridium sufflavum DSM 19573 TaxID=1121337 RepID=A0A318XJ91_9FIRM|nr:anaerobic ribonucleoside-triphosphate reductase activating protein [Ruminiclostridium sufflavum]PYG87074.1 anaerobic ribonucleoside-triphosphate reductase activating protein [Ruminiclostridium sufflavum DSM 19573]
MNQKIRVAGIINESIADGPGIRLVIFAQGCKHKCKGCHNPETHSFEGGELVDTDKILKDIRRNSLLDGVTLSGGDPFEQAGAFAELAREVRKMGKNVITYTGYTFEQLIKYSSEREGYKELLENTDILVDGPFILEKKSLMLKFKGSENQRIIDVPKSMESKKIVIAIE